MSRTPGTSHRKVPKAKAKAKAMAPRAKRQHNALVAGGEVFDGGEILEGGSPGGLWHTTEDGRRLTPEEAFRRAGESEGRASSPRTMAALFAIVLFEREHGIEVTDNISELARLVGDFASERGLTGSEHVGAGSSTFRAMLTDLHAELARDRQRSTPKG